MKQICLILLMLTGLDAWAQESISISGHVRDNESGKSLTAVQVVVKGSQKGTFTDINGHFQLSGVSPQDTLLFSFVGFETKEVAIQGQKVLEIGLDQVETQLEEVVITGSKPKISDEIVGLLKTETRQTNSVNKVRIKGRKKKSKDKQDSFKEAPSPTPNIGLMDGESPEKPLSREGYDKIEENTFKSVKDHPLSTFSIDVDRAAYANVRRFINNSQLPPQDAVRIEEMVNYFDYDYEQPRDEHPFNIITEMAHCPWNEKHELLQIALQGKDLDLREAPPSNLVFLLDVSGSMNSYNKLPLLKKGMELLVDELRPQDQVAIVVYAGAAGVVLSPTSGNNKKKIKNALNKLKAGGSTAGGAGIELAYKLALKNFLEEGNNRVILATDGDFNVGVSSDGALTRMIEEKRKEGVFLTVLGFGGGNYQDAKMEKLADHGNGNYAYIDNILEAQKVMVNEMSGTLYTVAKDVKIQIEFNPSKVKSYRLIGYENRLLNKEDFNDDTKDAGELGAGHTVTALYEVVPAEVEEELTASVDPLRYQEQNLTAKANSKEWLTVKFRYKPPQSDSSLLMVSSYSKKARSFKKASENLRFASAVAGFGMLLMDSKYKGSLNFDAVLKQAKASKGKDEEGYRAEFISLVKKASLLETSK